MGGLFVVFCLGSLVALGLFLGVHIGHAVRDQFDELLPQRMVDFSGFVDVAPSND
jgi:FAD synthase